MSITLTHRMVNTHSHNMFHFYSTSETMLDADVSRTMDNQGAYEVAQAALLVIATMEAEGRDDIAYAISKPHKFPEYWIPALAVNGKLYNHYGNRLWNAGDELWDFDIADDYLTFSLKEDEPED
jgi:hypothetical protein